MKPPLGEVPDLNERSLETTPEKSPAREKTIAQREVMEKRTYSSRRSWRSILIGRQPGSIQNGVCKHARKDPIR